jgi:hypothetical protein
MVVQPAAPPSLMPVSATAAVQSRQSILPRHGSQESLAVDPDWRRGAVESERSKAQLQESLKERSHSFTRPELVREGSAIFFRGHSSNDMATHRHDPKEELVRINQLGLKMKMPLDNRLRKRLAPGIMKESNACFGHLTWRKPDADGPPRPAAKYACLSDETNVNDGPQRQPALPLPLARSLSLSLSWRPATRCVTLWPCGRRALLCALSFFRLLDDCPDPDPLPCVLSVFRLLDECWQLRRPSVLLSVTGSAQDLDLEPRLANECAAPHVFPRSAEWIPRRGSAHTPRTHPPHHRPRMPL